MKDGKVMYVTSAVPFRRVCYNTLHFLPKKAVSVRNRFAVRFVRWLLSIPEVQELIADQFADSQFPGYHVLDETVRAGLVDIRADSIVNLDRAINDEVEAFFQSEGCIPAKCIDGLSSEVEECIDIEEITNEVANAVSDRLRGR
jgi:hypothetical protein